MAIANTNSLTTNFNVDPYYDDFNESKNFHRILFRPGFAVQARELTQMQTIQQNQLDRFAEHIFKEGSTVRGNDYVYSIDQPFVKIRDNDSTGTAVTANSFIGLTITGQTSGMTAEVIDALPGAEASSPDTNILYVAYTNSGANNTTKAFINNEILLADSGISANSLSANSTGFASYVTFNEGIIFAKDHFINVERQSIVVGRDSVNVNYKIGYEIDEKLISYLEDETLLDPAQGAYNYAAPGADRLKLTPRLVKKEISDTNEANFIEKLRIRNGVIDYKGGKSQYSIINDYIARRTFDESGNYIVSGLSPRLREHLSINNNGGVYTAAQGGNNSILSVDISPGKAYIKGYELENFNTKHIGIEKGLDTDTVNNLPIVTSYGNYVVVNEVVGTWDVNGHARVDLYDTAMNAISNNTISSTPPIGTKIGEARVRFLDYVSGTKGDRNATYNLYIYDINMTAGPFSDVRTIYYNDNDHDGFADIILESGNAVLKESSFNRVLYTIPASSVKTLTDKSFRFNKEFTSITLSSAGQFSLNSSADNGDGTNDTFIGGTTGAVISDSLVAENYTLISRGTNESASAVDTGSRSAGANTITGVVSATTKFNIGDKVKFISGDANTFVVSGISTAAGGTLNIIGPESNFGPAQSTNGIKKAFVPGQIISLVGNGENGARSITYTTPTSISVNINETLTSGFDVSLIAEMNDGDGTEIQKQLNTNNYVQIRVSDHPNNTSGPWSLGKSDGYQLLEVRRKTGNTLFSSTTEGSDITSQFTLDTGMRDNLYDHAKLKLKSSSAISVANGDVLLVKFNWFDHNTSTGRPSFFTVDSYPINDVNPSSTEITTGEIPVYVSPTTGERYDLRDAIDFRPRITDTANTVTTLTDITTNPAVSTIVDQPTSGLRFPAPNENFNTDVEFYLPRKDRIVMTELGTFRAIRGVPSLNPRTPDSPSDGMTLAIVNVKPFPSLPQQTANDIGRGDLAIKVDPIRIRRYTMRDIQTLEQRIDNLEYYTSLSFLESDTKNLFFADSSGIDRFKNGIIVDQFVDFTVSDYFDPDYTVSIDSESKELRPSFKVFDTAIEYVSGGEINGKLLTLPIVSEDKVIEQNFASGTKNLAGASYSFVGSLTLDPSTDFWQDTTQVPTVTIDFGDIADAFQQVANFTGTQWGSWRNVGAKQLTSTNVSISGGVEYTTQTYRQTIERFGKQLSVNAGKLVETDLGDSVRDVSIIPYIRSRIIKFIATGMKPNTKVFPFFDGESISSFCSPANTSFANTASEGSALITDASGTLRGLFRIPSGNALKFPTGRIKFRLTDSETNSNSLGSVSTSAETTYYAGGLDIVKQGTILSTRDVDVSIKTIRDTSSQSSSSTTTRQIYQRYLSNEGGNDGHSYDGYGGYRNPNPGFDFEPGSVSGATEAEAGGFDRGGGDFSDGWT